MNYSTILFFLLTISVGYSQSNSFLEIDVENHYYSILLKRTSQLEDGSIEYRLDAEAYDISSCTAIIATDESIEFGYFINNQEVTMREFVAFNPFGYTLGCGSIDKTRMGVFLIDAESAPPISNSSLIVKKGVIRSKNEPKPATKVVQPVVEVAKPKQTAKDVEVVKTIDGVQYLFIYKANGEIIQKPLNEEQKPIQSVKKIEQPKPVIEVKAPEKVEPKPAPVPKKEPKQKDVQVKRVINGIEYLITYSADGKITKKPLRKIEKEQAKPTPKPTVEVKQPAKPKPVAKQPEPVKEVIKVEQPKPSIQPKVTAPKAEPKKQVVKTFEQKEERELIYLPVIKGKERRQLLKLRYAPSSVVYIDGKRYTGYSAKNYIDTYHKSFLKMYPIPANMSGNNRNTYYLFTTHRAYVRSNYREKGDATGLAQDELTESELESED